MTIYHYTECGLQNVFIDGLKPVVDDDGDEVIEIPMINALHREIASGIVGHDKGMTGDELRFLRSEIGLTQAELARVLHVDKQTIGRWERGETEFESKAEALVRKLAIEKLGLLIDTGIDDLSRRSVPTAEMQEIRITASKDAYKLDKTPRAA